MPAASPSTVPSTHRAAMRAKRLRMTGQRRVIARVLSAARDHPDVEEVYRRATAVDSRISLSTVYRTIKLFEANGFLERHNFGAGRGRYEETAGRHHDHLIDIESGKRHRVPQRGDRAPAGAGGARAGVQPGRPQAGALRRADQAGHK